MHAADHHLVAMGYEQIAGVMFSLDLPEDWQRTLDTLTYPALAIAGTAVITAIIVNALGK